MAGQALAIKPKEFGDYLERQRANLERISGRMIDVPRLVTTVLLNFAKNPALLRCSQQSVFRAVLQAAELDVIPGAGNGDAYLVPFGNECVLVPGYRGYVRKAIESGKIDDVQPRAVFQGDEFSYSFGLNPDLEHRPCGNTNPDELTHAYVVVFFTNGRTRFDVMTRAEIDKIRAQSAGKNGDLWTKHFAAAAKKCPIRRDAKFWPLTRDMEKMLALDNAIDVGDASLMEFELPEAQPETVQKAANEEKVETAKKAMRKEPNIAPDGGKKQAPPAATKPADIEPCVACGSTGPVGSCNCTMDQIDEARAEEHGRPEDDGDGTLGLDVPAAASGKGHGD